MYPYQGADQPEHSHPPHPHYSVQANSDDDFLIDDFLPNTELQSSLPLCRFTLASTSCQLVAPIIIKEILTSLQCALSVSNEDGRTDDGSHISDPCSLAGAFQSAAGP